MSYRPQANHSENANGLLNVKKTERKFEFKTKTAVGKVGYVFSHPMHIY
jgi:hypothetical protein